MSDKPKAILTRKDLLSCGFDEDVDGITLSILTMFYLIGIPKPNGCYIVEFMGEWEMSFRSVSHLKDFIEVFIESE